MKSFRRNDLKREAHPGRFIQRAMGRGKQFSPSEHFTIGFAHFSAEAGPMEPHEHAEEGIYVIDVKDGWVDWGPGKDRLTERTDLAAGMLLHVPAGEWHVFRYGEGGFVDILHVYAPPI